MWARWQGEEESWWSWWKWGESVFFVCFQESRWKGNKAKELGEGYKLHYSAATTDGINGVGIIVSEKIKQYVTDVKREGDRLMVLRLVCEDCPINIVSVDAPQTGLPEEVKQEFWVDVVRVIEGLAAEERVIVGTDLNGHIGTSGEMVERIHGGFGFGRANAEGRRDAGLRCVVWSCNFKHFLLQERGAPDPYKKGGNKAQIDFMM